MFSRLIDADVLASGATPEQSARDLFALHPSELSLLLESAWDTLRRGARPPPPSPVNNVSNLNSLLSVPNPPIRPPALPLGATLGRFVGLIAAATRAVGPLPTWDHLIYAYMIENTRIYEIFRRVVHEYLHGEKLGTPSEATQLWLRNTEELFFRDSPPFSITTLSSHIRPDLRATRRNAYWRMFGMDLTHGSEDGSPYPYIKANAANNEFVSTFEEFLREVWIGHVNQAAIAGPRPTDDSKIEDLANKLRDMLVARRRAGNLSREEFFFISMMSWFHVTVSSGDAIPIIADLRARGPAEEQRLFKIAPQVGLPAHGLSRSYFKIAQDLSTVLLQIESGALNTPGSAAALYTTGTALAGAMNTVITHWSLITGRDMKAGRVASA